MFSLIPSKWKNKSSFFDLASLVETLTDKVICIDSENTRCSFWLKLGVGVSQNPQKLNSDHFQLNANGETLFCWAGEGSILIIQTIWWKIAWQNKSEKDMLLTEAIKYSLDRGWNKSFKTGGISPLTFSNKKNV